MTWDRVVLLQPSHAAGRAARLGAALGLPACEGWEEPPDDRCGNLGATVRVWRALRDRVGTRDRVLLLHDAGAASRSGAWARALGGRRTDLPLPGRDPTLLHAIVRGLWPLANVNPGGFVDVAWTSQFLALPTHLPPPSADLTKLVAARPPVDDPAQRELGWFRLDAAGHPTALAPGRTLPTHDALVAFGLGATLAADVGTFRASFDLLDRLAAVDVDGLDLDPGLTGPLLAAASGAAPTPVVTALGQPAPTVGVLDIGDAGWWRLRRPREVWTMLRDPAALAALGITRRAVRSTAGGVPLDHLDDAALAAGLTVGGCFLRDVVLHDVHLEPGSELQHVTARDVRGRVTARHAVLLDAEGDLSGDHGLALRTGSGTFRHGTLIGGHNDPW